MKTYKEIRSKYTKYICYYMRNVNNLKFEEADYCYSTAYELAWVLNRDISKDIGRLINVGMYVK